MKIDLHTHTTCSDGLLTPKELIELVKSMSVGAFSITDHDCIDGYLEAKSLLNESDPDLIPGIELSVTYGGSDIHMLAYYFDPEDEDLQTMIRGFCDNRNQRAERMVEKLNKLGLKITMEQVIETAGGGVIGRPHIAETLAQNSALNDYEDAFRKYIGDGKPACVPKENLGPEEAIKIIHAAKGVAVLAHPMINNNRRHIEFLTECGLDGLEVIHPFHSATDVRFLKEAANRYRLIMTGGSDYHGREGRYAMLGSLDLPEEWLSTLKQTAEQKRREDIE